MKTLLLLTLALIANMANAADRSVNELSDVELCLEWDERVKMHSTSSGFFASLWSPSSNKRRSPEMSFMRVSDLIRERNLRELSCTINYPS
ncbi:MAG: hypothetical protein ABGY96_27620 [bacterium]|nr:hypothetical protein [Gammaproteobacteria bacterium]HIL97237.1 hypothetical protein [Pseudomonadales bacterium]